MPGYAACFADLWESSFALELVRHFASPTALLAAGFEQVASVLRKSGLRFVNSMLEKVFVWAKLAAAPDAIAARHHGVWQLLYADYAQKCREIAALEVDVAGLLVRTPYVLLLSFPGINVVSAGELAGEMGPIENYRNAKAITGRAGIFPSRYQSDQVDLAHGSLVRSCC
jgi:transposase